MTSGNLMPPSVTDIRRISSGDKIPNWIRFTVLTGALESPVLIPDMVTSLGDQTADFTTFLTPLTFSLCFKMASANLPFSLCGANWISLATNSVIHEQLTFCFA